MTFVRIKRPEVEVGEYTIASHLEGKFESRRDFGRFLDQLNAKTRRPRRRARRRGNAAGSGSAS